ncbi:MAG TPA: hypothetical protein VIJ94_02970 [Caulobacteraceae bacterium]
MAGYKDWFGLKAAPALRAAALLLAVGLPVTAAAQVRAGESAAKPFNQVQTIYPGPGGVPSFKNDTVLGLMAPPGHYTTLDIIAYTGQRTAGGAYGGIQTEAYGCSNATGACPVAGQQVVAAYSAAAFNGVGDTTDASTLMMTTEAHTPKHNGMDVEFWYTPNGSTAFTKGAALSPGGAGGFVIGAPPTGDLGKGTLNVQDTVAVGSHLRSTGAAPTLSSCGQGAFVPGANSNDVRGEVANGGAGVSSCQVTFHKAYASPQTCMVQDYANASPAAYVSALSLTSFTVSWPASYSGAWSYICMG